MSADTRALLDLFAATVRSSRQARRWTQKRLADGLHLSPAHVSRIERSAVPDLSFALAGRVLDALGGRLEVRVIGAAGGAPTQRDRAHARCVAYVARRLAAAGFEVATEVEIGAGRWRTFADVTAFHPHEHILLVTEVKTEIRDLGQIDRQLGIAEREVWVTARARGWRPRAVVPALLILSTRENDRRVAENRRYFETRYPIRMRGLQAIVEAGGTTAVPPGRAVAMIDPRSRRRCWLLATTLDGRRSQARYADRAAYLGVTAAVALAIVLAGLLGGCQPPNPPASVPVSPPISGSPTPAPTGVDAAGAKAAIERFLGRSVDAEVTGPTVTPANGPIFELQGASLTATVSAADGRVISVLLLDEMPNSRTTKLSPADALSAGVAYAADHEISIDGLAAVVELMDHGETVAYRVTWTLFDGDIELPVKTIVQVDAASGDVFNFLDIRRAFVDPPDPAITGELAIGAARLAASMPSARADGAHLRVTFTPDGTQQLAWEVALTEGISHALVQVDAVTGLAVVVGRG